MSVDFDAMLPHIGEMGRYQLGLYLIMCVPATLPAAFLAFNQVFISGEPDHWCRVPEVLAQGNLSQWQAGFLMTMAMTIFFNSSFRAEVDH